MIHGGTLYTLSSPPQNDPVSFPHFRFVADPY